MAKEKRDALRCVSFFVVGEGEGLQGQGAIDVVDVLLRVVDVLVVVDVLDPRATLKKRQARIRERQKGFRQRIACVCRSTEQCL